MNRGSRRRWKGHGDGAKNGGLCRINAVKREMFGPSVFIRKGCSVQLLTGCKYNATWPLKYLARDWYPFSRGFPSLPPLRCLRVC